MRFEAHWLFAIALTHLGKMEVARASLIDANLSPEAAQSQVLHELERAENVQLVGPWRGEHERWNADLRPISRTDS
jgi:hypothetical protein